MLRTSAGKLGGEFDGGHEQRDELSLSCRSLSAGIPALTYNINMRASLCLYVQNAYMYICIEYVQNMGLLVIPQKNIKCE